MKATITLRLAAINNTLAKVSDTNWDENGELEEQITSQILDLEKLVQSNEALNKSYEKERLDLRDQYKSQVTYFRPGT